ncbi:fibrinogen beta chain isoform X1 [Petromyzon marinus]
MKWFWILCLVLPLTAAEDLSLVGQPENDYDTGDDDTAADPDSNNTAAALDVRGVRPLPSGTRVRRPPLPPPASGSGRRYEPRPTSVPKAGQEAQKAIRDEGGCMLPESDLGVLCPTGCELREELLKQRDPVRYKISMLKQNLTYFINSFDRMASDSNTLKQNVQTLRRRLNSRSSTHVDAQKEIENRYKEVKIRIESTVAGSLRSMKSVLEHLRAKMQRMEEAIKTQKELCSAPCTVNCHVPVVSGMHCEDIYRNGGRTSEAYYIQPDLFSKPYKVFCDMESHGGGWTVVQNRVDGSSNFARDWNTYKAGFGNIAFDNGKSICNIPGEYWLGTETVHQLTKQHTQQVLFDMSDWEGSSVYAQYASFRLENEAQGYRLWVEDYSGNAGNALLEGATQLMGDNRTMTIHNGMQFSTFDRDNDNWNPGDPTKHCSREDAGGWWYNRCHAANPNGRYYWGGIYTKEQADYGTDDGVVWMNWKGSWYSMRQMAMKLRPKWP